MGSKSLRLTQATTRSLLISAQYCPEFLVCQEERRTSRFRTPTRHMYVCISIRPAEKTKGISWTATRVLILSQRYSMPGHQRLSQTSESSQYRIHQASPTRQSPDLFNSAVLLIHPTQTEKRSLPYMKLIVLSTKEDFRNLSAAGCRDQLDNDVGVQKTSRRRHLRTADSERWILLEASSTNTPFLGRLA